VAANWLLLDLFYLKAKLLDYLGEGEDLWFNSHHHV
jgi:hypothetical protein